MAFERDGIIVWLKVEGASAHEAVQAHHGSFNNLPCVRFPIASRRGCSRLTYRTVVRDPGFCTVAPKHSLWLPMMQPAGLKDRRHRPVFSEAVDASRQKTGSPTDRRWWRVQRP